MKCKKKKKTIIIEIDFWEIDFIGQYRVFDEVKKEFQNKVH